MSNGRRRWLHRAVALGAVALLGGVATVAISSLHPRDPHRWNSDEVARIKSLSLTGVSAPEPDPSNRVAGDPRAVALGRELFFDQRLSANGEISCATCHDPELGFTDGRTVGKGLEEGHRNTPTVVGAGFSRWLFWDGRRDTLWAQALDPLEDPAEQGTTRTRIAQLMASAYRANYEPIFGALPEVDDPIRFPPLASPRGDAEAIAAWEAMTQADRDVVTEVAVNAAKAIAAFEAQIVPGTTRLDRYADALGRDAEGVAPQGILTDLEAEGLRIFIGQGACTDCHSGPMLTNGDFHSIGLPPTPGERFDVGRIDGAPEVAAAEFGCASQHGDMPPEQCEDIRFLKTSGFELVGAFKVPSLRNVARTAPYMHRGQLATLDDVVAHYDDPPEAIIGHTDLLPLELSDREAAALAAFLGVLDAAPRELASAEPSTAGAGAEAPMVTR